MGQPEQRKPRLDADFWSGRYRDAATAWDLGAAAPALMHAVHALHCAGALAFDAPILIPGAGRGYEAEALHRAGFRQVHVLDWAAEALEALRFRVPDFPKEHMHREDFFTHRPRAKPAPVGADAGYAMLIEQTFFCAIPPERREDYVAQAAHLLVPGGLLTGLLFGVPLNDAAKGEGPPYGGDADAYRRLFQVHFDVEHLETATHSIAPRAGRELLIRARVRR